MTMSQLAIILSLAVSLWCMLGDASDATETRIQQRKPNVLFIAIDDLNDWTGILHGTVQAHTPCIDGLASKGIVFINAHCAAPCCGP